MTDKNVSLGTTALREFWEKDKKLVLLGNHCLIADLGDEFQIKEILPNPYTTREEAKTAYKKVCEVQERVLSALAAVLNEVHHEEHSQRYWRLLLGTWLVHYISVLYDRFLTIKLAINKWPHLSSIVLSDNSTIVPRNTLEFINFTKTDTYNLQIYSQILKHFGAQVIEKELSQKHLSQSQTPEGVLKKLLKSLYDRNFFNGPSTRIYLYRPYFTRSVEVRTYFKSQGRAGFGHGALLELESHFAVNKNLRERLREKAALDGEFERFVWDMVCRDLPMVYLEEYRAQRKDAEKIGGHRPAYIASAVSWHLDEAFKFWAADRMESGSKIVGIQHGGNYGSLQEGLVRNHELSVSDIYFSWGWTDEDHRAKVVPMPATKFVGRKAFKTSEKKRKILYVGTSEPRYMACFPFTSNYIDKLIENENRFLRAFPHRLCPHLFYRFHAEDFGRNHLKRVKEIIPDVNIDKTPHYLKSMSDSRLLIFNHLSTTFKEALIQNRPVLLFWQNDLYPLTSHSQKYYDELRRVGILLESPEEAAKFIDENYDSINQWWYAEDRQKAVKQFTFNYVRTSPNSLSLWAKKLSTF